jgi:hypothetical protein
LTLAGLRRFTGGTDRQGVDERRRCRLVARRRFVRDCAARAGAAPAVTPLLGTRAVAASFATSFAATFAATFAASFAATFAATAARSAAFCGLARFRTCRVAAGVAGTIASSASLAFTARRRAVAGELAAPAVAAVAAATTASPAPVTALAAIVALTAIAP